MPCGSNEIEHFEMTISENGIKLEAHGYRGDACIKESADIENAIGKPHKRSFKKEFYAKVKGVTKLFGGKG